MKHMLSIWIVLLAAVGGFVGGSVYAAQLTLEPIGYLPTIKREPAQQPPVTTRLVELVDTDAGFVHAAVIPGTNRVVVAYIDRRQGNRLFVGEHIGDTIQPLPDPEFQRLASLLLFGDVLPPSPSFVYPGPKQGNGAVVFVGQEMRVYAVSRRVDDPSGPFPVMVLIAPIPPAP